MANHETELSRASRRNSNSNSTNYLGSMTGPPMTERYHTDDWANDQTIRHRILVREISKTMERMDSILATITIVHCAVMSVVVLFCHNLNQTSDWIIGGLIFIHYFLMALANFVVLWISDPELSSVNQLRSSSTTTTSQISSERRLMRSSTMTLVYSDDFAAQMRAGLSLEKILLVQLSVLFISVVIESLSYNFSMFSAAFLMHGIGEALPDAIRGQLLRLLPPKQALKGVSLVNIWTILAVITGLFCGALTQQLLKISYVFAVCSVICGLALLAYYGFIFGSEARLMHSAVEFVAVYRCVDQWIAEGRPTTRPSGEAHDWAELVNVANRLPIAQEILERERRDSQVGSYAGRRSSLTIGGDRRNSVDDSRELEKNEDDFDDMADDMEKEQTRSLMADSHHHGYELNAHSIEDRGFLMEFFCGEKLMPVTLAILNVAILLSMEGIWLTWYNAYLKHRYGKTVAIGNLHMIVLYVTQSVVIAAAMHWIGTADEREEESDPQQQSVDRLAQRMSGWPTMIVCVIYALILCVICPSVGKPELYLVMWLIMGVLNGFLASVFQTQIVTGNVTEYSGRIQAMSTAVQSLGRGIGSLFAGIMWSVDTRSVLSAIDYGVLDSSEARNSHLWFWYCLACLVSVITLTTMIYRGVCVPYRDHSYLRL